MTKKTRSGKLVSFRVGLDRHEALKSEAAKKNVQLGTILNDALNDHFSTDAAHRAKGVLWRRLYDCATEPGQVFLMKLSTAAGISYQEWLPKEYWDGDSPAGKGSNDALDS